VSMRELLSTGIASREDIQKTTPPQRRREKGPFVVVECFQRIPCDPCYHACRFGAIKKMKDINDIPEVDWEKCTGCGVCVAACPGLAIFVVDETFSHDECLIAIPYEFTPLPKKGQRLLLLDRSGEPQGFGLTERVLPGKKPQGTPVVWVRALKGLSMVVRNFRVVEEDGENGWAR